MGFLLQRIEERMDDMDKYSVIICILGLAYGIFQSFLIHSNAQSVMHQIYGGQYSIIATMFLCTLLIICAVSKK